MKVEGTYTTAKIYAHDVEYGVYDQVKEIVNCKAFDECTIVCMPDVHVGKSGPCGLVAEIKDYVCPEHVGVDIGCTVSLVKYEGEIDPSDYPIIEHKIKQNVPMGNNIHKNCIVDEKSFCKFLSNEFQKAKQKHPAYLGNLPNTVTEKWISDVCNRIGMDEGKFWKSLGTIGSGNHYIEINKDDHNNIAVSLHFGSRNFGLKVAKYWMNIANTSTLTGKERKEITKYFKEAYKDSHKDEKGKSDMSNFKRDLDDYLNVFTEDNIKGYLRGDKMCEYLCDMVFAQAYAKYNHYTVQEIINNILMKFSVYPLTEIITTHNYIDFRSDDKGCTHLILRKSAISANNGEKVLIPFNMRDGIAECTGLGNKKWLCSAPHGSGRVMSRSEAKKYISVEKMTEDMKGIYTTSVCPGTVDEAPDAYKDTNSIISQIDGITVNIDKLWKPVINIKAAS